jgi:hypothetical protein
MAIGQTQRRHGVQTALLVAGAVQLAAWLWYAAAVWRTQGLFSRIGLDFGFFWATARAYVLSGPGALFDLDAIARAAQPLVAYYASPASAPLNVAPAVYPPLFFALLVPLTGLPPLLGLALWTAAGFGAAAAALLGTVSLPPPAPGGRSAHRRSIPLVMRVPWGTFLSALSFGPLALTILLGQVEGLLLYALYRSYRALVERRDLAAGLWLGVLFLKPQYAVFLALVLVGKQRWRAAGGLALAGGAVAGLSLAAIGGDVTAYVHALGGAVAFRPAPDAAAHAPGDMISWRGLLYTLLPGLTPAQGTILTLALSAGTVALLPLIWRGPWRPDDPSFPRRILASLLVNMLASFHNQLHGAALVLIPALAAARAGVDRRLATLLVAALYAPSLPYLMGDVALAAQLTVVLIVATLLSTIAPELSGARGAYNLRASEHRADPLAIPRAPSLA